MSTTQHNPMTDSPEFRQFKRQARTIYRIEMDAWKASGARTRPIGSTFTVELIDG